MTDALVWRKKARSFDFIATLEDEHMGPFTATLVSFGKKMDGATSRLVSMAYPLVDRIASHLRAGGSVYDKDDLVQETFLRLLDSRTAAQQATDATGFFNMFVRRVRVGRLRHENAQKRDPKTGHAPVPVVHGGHAVPAPDEVVATNELRERLLASLNEIQREVFKLREQEYNAPEIAERLGISRSQVNHAVAAIQRKKRDMDNG
ncbi:MAG: sigma-70 family RNA polymerase sigma factor [Isosphaeraceae bacterium]